MSPEREYATLKALRRGEVADLGGILLKMDEGEIRPGDLYIGERNTGPQLLTAQKVDLELGCIHATTPDYSYDLHECVKVCEA